MHTATSYSVDEYLALDEAAPEGVRLEYWDGLLYVQGQPYDPDWGWEPAQAMAGASPQHARITARLVTQLNNRLSRDCEAVASDLRVHTSETAYTYPDVVVFCGEMDLTEDRPPSLLNPLVLVEVLSGSTEGADRGRKMESYTRIGSLREYWIVEPEEPKIIRYVRREAEWVLHIEGGRDTVIRSKHLGVEIPLAEIYRRDSLVQGGSE